MQHKFKFSLTIAIVTLIFITTFTYSQKPFKSIRQIATGFESKSITDTLRPLSFVYGTLTIDTALAGGYVCGTNAYQDSAKAQIYYIEDSLSYFVNGCALDIGNIQINDTSKYLIVNVYDMYGIGYNHEGLVYDSVPGNILYSIQVPVSLLSNNQINYLNFPDAVWVKYGYAIGIDFTEFGTNQIGLISTSDGDAQHRELAWEKLNNGQWHSMFSSWPFDGDMGIFSLIDASTASIYSANKQEMNFFNVYPNPINNNILYISGQSVSETNADIHIYDMLGNSVYQHEVSLSKGENTIAVNLPELKTGNYFLSFKTLNNNYIKKITVL